MLFNSSALTFKTLTTSAGGTTCADLMSATTTPYTIVWARITTRYDENPNAWIYLGGTTEVLQSRGDENTWTFAPIKVPVNTAITCARTSGKSITFEVVVEPTASLYYPQDVRLLESEVGFTVDTSSTPVDFTGTNERLDYGVVLLVVLVVVGLIDFFRRITASKYKR